MVHMFLRSFDIILEDEKDCKGMIGDKRRKNIGC